MKSKAFFALLFGIIQLGHAGEQLELQSGNKTVGGTVQIPLEYSKSGVLRFGLDISPELGLFVADNWLLSFGPTFTNLAVHSSDTSLVATNPYRWGSQLKMRYFFDTGSSFYPFVGLGAGISLNNWTLITLRWVFEIPIGVTWAVSKNVGIQVAAPLSFEGGPLGAFEKFRVTPGYFGLIGFF